MPRQVVETFVRDPNMQRFYSEFECVGNIPMIAEEFVLGTYLKYSGALGNTRYFPSMSYSDYIRNYSAGWNHTALYEMVDKSAAIQSVANAVASFNNFKPETSNSGTLFVKTIGHSLAIDANSWVCCLLWHQKKVMQHHGECEDTHTHARCKALVNISSVSETRRL